MLSPLLFVNTSNTENPDKWAEIKQACHVLYPETGLNFFRLF